MIKNLLRKYLKYEKILIIKSREMSFFGFIFFLAGFIFKSYNILIFVKDLSEDIFPLAKCDLGQNICKGNLDEIKNTRKSNPFLPWEFYCDIYDGVLDCFNFKDSIGNIGHISWIYYCYNNNNIISLNNDEAEIKYCMTLPKYRGRNIYPATLIKIQQYLKDKKYKRVFIRCNEDNVPSINGIKKAGFKLIKKIHVVNFMGILFYDKYKFEI